MTNNENEALFTYGTLQDEYTQYQILKRIVTATQEDRVYGFQRRMDMFPPYPVAVKEDSTSDNDDSSSSSSSSSNTYIDGTVLFVSKHELRFMDTYETNAYTRVQVNLESGLKAWMYVGTEGYFDDLSG